MTDTDVRRIEDKVDGLALVLARLEGSLSPTLSALTEGQEDLEKRQEAHEAAAEARFEKLESRTSALERFRYSIPSLALLSLVVAAGTLIYLLAAHGGTP